MKNFTYTIFLLLLSATLSFSQSITDSLIVYYSFDGHSNDVSGNGLHAIVNGAILSTDRNGGLDSAYFFDGTDDFIQMPINSILKPDLPITISFWVKLESLVIDDNKWVSTEDVYNNYTGINVALSSGSTGAWHVTIGDGTGAGPSHRRTKTSASGITTIGTWHHIAAVMRGVADIDLYVDCINVGGNYTGTGGSLAYIDSTGDIGRIHGITATPWTRYFWGTMDDYAMWNRALSQTEIVQLCNNGITTGVLDYEAAQSDRIVVDTYPNPFTSTCNFRLLGDVKGVLNFQLTDASGREVYTRVVENVTTEFAIDNLTQGVYFYSLSNKDGSIFKNGKIVSY